jgi:hypothetical protein
MNYQLYSASGVDPNQGATKVFVWCRDKASERGLILLGSGGVVPPAAALPGVRPGEFRVSFQLPSGYSADSIVVTDDLRKEAFIADVSVTLCDPSGALSVKLPRPQQGAAGR